MIGGCPLFLAKPSWWLRAGRGQLSNGAAWAQGMPWGGVTKDMDKLRVQQRTTLMNQGLDNRPGGTGLEERDDLVRGREDCRGGS